MIGNKFVNPDLGGISEVYTGHYDVTGNYGLHLYTRLVGKPLNFATMATVNSTLGEVWRKVLYGDEAIPKC